MFGRGKWYQGHRIPEKCQTGGKRIDLSEYEQMYNLESFYWWFVARRKLLREVIEENEAMRGVTILDVGCGTGLNYSVLSQFGKVFSADFSEAALEFSRKRGLPNLVHSRAEHLEFSSDQFDLLSALDILEHTDDDLLALTEMKRVLKPGGALVITVPAYGFLWSEHDEALHPAAAIVLTNFVIN